MAVRLFKDSAFLCLLVGTPLASLCRGISGKPGSFVVGRSTGSGVSPIFVCTLALTLVAVGPQFLICKVGLTKIRQGSHGTCLEEATETDALPVLVDLPPVTLRGVPCWPV